jgi:hypothetical protein
MIEDAGWSSAADCASGDGECYCEWIVDMWGGLEGACNATLPDPITADMWMHCPATCNSIMDYDCPGTIEITEPFICDNPKGANCGDSCGPGFGYSCYGCELTNIAQCYSVGMMPDNNIVQY